MSKAVLPDIDWLNFHFAEAVKWRRDLHSHPQPRWMEFYATGYITEKLQEWGYTVTLGADIISPDKQWMPPTPAEAQREFDRAVAAGINEAIIRPAAGGLTGVVATLQGNKPGPVVAFRFDIDSNEVLESSSLVHRPAKEGFGSLFPGYAHMCGHDAHAAMGLFIAKYFKEHQDKIHGSVKFIFQPNEENMAGAVAMVDKGVVDGVDYLLGGHVGLNLKEIGHIALNIHSFMALTRYEVTFTGRPSHAALRPNEGNNALQGACAAIANLYAIPRHGQGASRINIGRIEAGSAWNVIAGKAYFQLETRGVTNEINDYMVDKAMAVIEGTAKMYNLAFETKLAARGFAGKGDQELMELGTDIAKQLPSVSKVWPEVGFDASEDITVFMERVQKNGGKALFAVFGTPVCGGHHNSTFDIDEQVIKNGAEFLTAMYLNIISNYPQL